VDEELLVFEELQESVFVFEAEFDPVLELAADLVTELLAEVLAVGLEDLDPLGVGVNDRLGVTVVDAVLLCEANFVFEAEAICDPEWLGVLLLVWEFDRVWLRVLVGVAALDKVPVGLSVRVLLTLGEILCVLSENVADLLLEAESEGDSALNELDELSVREVVRVFDGVLLCVPLLVGVPLCVMELLGESVELLLLVMVCDGLTGGV
jgi:hypothetical protein